MLVLEFYILITVLINFLFYIRKLFTFNRLNMLSQLIKLIIKGLALSFFACKRIQRRPCS